MIKPPPKGTRVAVYGRVASAMQSEIGSQSLLLASDQIALCRLFAEDHGWDVVGVYSDLASGSREGGQFAQMMKDAAKGLFEVLLVRDLTRLGRDSTFVQQVLNALGAVGVSVGVVPNSPVVCYDCVNLESKAAADGG